MTAMKVKGARTARAYPYLYTKPGRLCVMTHDPADHDKPDKSYALTVQGATRMGTWLHAGGYKEWIFSSSVDHAEDDGWDNDGDPREIINAGWIIGAVVAKTNAAFDSIQLLGNILARYGPGDRLSEADLTVMRAHLKRAGKTLKGLGARGGRS